MPIAGPRIKHHDPAAAAVLARFVPSLRRHERQALVARGHPGPLAQGGAPTCALGPRHRVVMVEMVRSATGEVGLGLGEHAWNPVVSARRRATGRWTSLFRALVQAE